MTPSSDRPRLTFEQRTALKQLVSEARAARAKILEADDSVRECRMCGVIFEATRPSRQFCSATHRKVWWERYSHAGREWKQRQNRARPSVASPDRRAA